jgi:hypothetical protein
MTRAIYDAGDCEDFELFDAVVKLLKAIEHKTFSEGKRAQEILRILHLYKSSKSSQSPASYIALVIRGTNGDGSSSSDSVLSFCDFSLQNTFRESQSIYIESIIKDLNQIAGSISSSQGNSTHRNKSTFTHSVVTHSDRKEK